MPKENCKYWDKCYQRNEHHLEKYNHPKTEAENIKQQEDQNVSTQNVAPKRKNSSSKDNNSQTATTTSATSETPNTSGRSSSANSGIETPHNNNNKYAGDDGKYETEELRQEAMNNIAGKNYMEILEKRIRLSVQQEYDNLCGSNEFIRHKFLVEMPPDFYEFWKFVNQIKKDSKNMEALKFLEKQFQLQLVGPFEFLAGRFHNAKILEPGDYLRHWRFYYDPPEFQTVFVRRGTGVHYGYWRDTPEDKEKLLVARNDASKGCEIEFVAGNIFGAFLYYLEKDFVGSPFTAAILPATKKSVQQYIATQSLELESLEHLKKLRNQKVVTKSFHRAGIVVPFDRRSQQGYRPLMVSDAELKKILKLLEQIQDKNDLLIIAAVKKAVIEKLQPVANAANIAVDECDFGTALELGIDLFCSGYKELHNLLASVLMPAYSLLKRPQFVAIAKAHMDERRRNFQLSMFDNFSPN